MERRSASTADGRTDKLGLRSAGLRPDLVAIMHMVKLQPRPPRRCEGPLCGILAELESLGRPSCHPQ